MNLDELERLAKQAIPAPWSWTYDGSSDWSIGPYDPQVNKYFNIHAYDWEKTALTVPHIAAADPTTILKLIEAVRTTLRRLHASANCAGGPTCDCAKYEHDEREAYAALHIE